MTTYLVIIALVWSILVIVLLACVIIAGRDDE